MRFKWIDILWLLSMVCFVHTVSATHNRAGEITYTQIDDLTIECLVTTYTKESSTSADRDSILVNWGDGSFSILYRENGPGMKGESLGNDIKKNIYRGRHTYPGRGTYTIGMQDPNRVADVKNIPNSVNVKFFISTTLTLLNTQFQGSNSSAILLQPPIDVGCVGRPFIHNPNAYDPDGDSLSYRLIVPYLGPDTIIQGYTFPDQVLPGPGNIVKLDERTGDFTWETPQIEGEFNIAIEIQEWRNGIMINSIIRDMQIAIFVCDNEPPLIEAATEICVVAGEYLELEISGNDLDQPGDLILLTATGGALDLDLSPATFEAPSTFQIGPVVGLFKWQTTCDHVRKEPYTIVFKAEDDPASIPTLVDLHALSIKVVAPPPLDVQGEPENDSILVTWESPYRCETAADNYFYGFSIWRKIGSQNIPLDTCNPGIEGQGYALIDYQTSTLQNGRYFYRDGTAEKGQTYCYRILSEFARRNPAGFPYNFVESLVSDEICLQLSRDLPLILNVDVINTDSDNGQIFVKWTKPLAEELDTLLRPGPYVYQVQRRIRDGVSYQDVPGARFVSPNFSSNIDTAFTDSLLNTSENSYEYQIDFTYGGLPSFRVSEDASSIFLTTINSDRQIELMWTEEVPWDNKFYEVLMQNGSGGFDTLARTPDTSFLVRDLKNDTPYCFKILSFGDYGIQGITNPLLNNSQIQCGIPLDSVAPCSPDVEVSNLCDSEENIPGDAFFNTVSWNDPRFICESSSDIAGFIVYFRRSLEDPWEAIDTVPYGTSFEIDHLPGISASGCYAVTSIDSIGNQSKIEQFACIENCPLYELPNAFTPNQNGQNDLFTPRKKRFIDHVDFKVFNKWGALVFSTDDADINWNGSDLKGKELADGTYFYTCVVFEREYDGIIRRENLLSGYIELIRSNP